MSKPFTFKYNLLDFSRFPEVKAIVEEIKKVNIKNRIQFIEENLIEERLIDIYWLKVYGSLDVAEEAFAILEKTLFNPMQLTNKEQLVKDIKKYTDKSKTENLYEKIISVCPNGDSVVDQLLSELTEEYRGGY